ncbi:aminotransferase class I/II-fold pyridoxal phosphate-dependent enzyme [Methylovulum psychrotolerans]|jgi:8-amino-7-oxononanoate synthase|uniref:8-amino-7-oxononanoate synthase n=1 Tax=Methylovulum psychrotolerans TaxID=1704499 RepID=A0A1Z4BVM6_9GAMM|nr:aminotransferase class I/II-fold pyridoxal phosphate-dependent enzyme [Methylovulum psychrotolerans]ASF45355.1 8-amino-7-oxononanoate synthase [Methylovulum psychrotolerans]MBT9099434.1 aminotransferase class I/II-fold pyridoxal phosphate-dependent enzyme [Methylovulum psychrotolerans]
MTGKSLSGHLKDKLIQQALEHKLKQLEKSPSGLNPLAKHADIPEAWCRFDQQAGYKQIQLIYKGSTQLGVGNPFFRLHEGVAGATTQIGGQTYINYASYNYLGLSGDPRVSQAAKDAVDQYGTSVSASRLVSGERPVHRQLETAIAQTYGVDDAVVMVSGHATNVTTIGYLFGTNDLIVHDELIHNSSLIGAQLSGAKRLSFPHNDYAALDRLLQENRRQYERVLIILEGLYSMDGDYPDLPEFIAVKRKHKAFLMVDEAHSLGVMGNSGLGIRDHFGIDGKEVDIWMGTLSKTLAGCGGFIAGESALVEHLKFLAPGFLYSVGMPAQVAAPTLAALHILKQEPERVRRLQQLSAYFLAQAQRLGMDTGQSQGIAIIAALTGSSLSAVRMSEALFQKGINVQPILYPAVSEKSARLRFFISCEHTEAQIDQTLQAYREEMP